MRNSYDRTKTRKSLAIIMALVAFMALFAACGKKAPGITQQDIVDDYAKIALQKETMSLRMEQAVEASEAWLNQTASEEETDAMLEELYNQIVDEYNALESYGLSDEMKQALEKHGIDSADYVAMADERINDFYNDALSIEYMLAYLESSDYDGMTQYVDMQKGIIKAENEYNAWAINYLFCGWSGDALDYVQENIVGKLAEEHQLSEWLTERNEVEERAAKCLNQIEGLATEQQQQIERDKLALEQEKAEMEA